MEDFLEDIVDLVEETSTSDNTENTKKSEAITQADVKSYNFKKPDNFKRAYPLLADDS